MSNTLLSKRAKELEYDLKAKLKCYVKVGWMRESDGSEVYVVYADYRAPFDERDVPSSWYGNLVMLQLIAPPGVDPTGDPWSGMPW